MHQSKLHRMALSAAVVTYLLVAAAGSRLSGSLAPVALGTGILLAALLTWVAVVTYKETYPSGLPMFRSQWQVPLYAAASTFVTTVLGSYLKSVGSQAACSQWPLCTELLRGDLSWVAAAHVAHRFSAGLTGLFLVYTVVYVARKHQNRPLLLTLTGSAVVLFTVQILLGQQAVEFGLRPFQSVAHLAIAVGLIGTLVLLAGVGHAAPSLPSIAGASQALALALPSDLSLKERLRAYLDATKPRILILLLITGYAAMWVAAGGAPPLGLTLVTIVGLGMSCGAANAINMWYDQDIDSIMKRTRKRPIPSGRLSPGQVLTFGIMTGALSFVLLAAMVNLMTALLSLAGLLFYVLIYTMWLKRSTVQNIVIGGAAGAVPPLVGWAAVTGEVSWASLIMFLIVFMWTPPHFWSLALFRNEDYRTANVPMMPVIHGEMRTKWESVVYALLCIPTVTALYLTGVVGEFYLWSSAALGVSFLATTLFQLRERLPSYKWALRNFIWSIFWLGLIFFVMVVDAR